MRLLAVLGLVVAFSASGCADRVTGEGYTPPPDSGVIASTPVDTTPLGAAPPPGEGEDAAEAVIAIAPSDPRTIYVSAIDRGLFRTTDGGRTWRPLPLAGRYGAGALAVSPGNPKLVLAGGDRPYRSTDGGESWAAAASGFDSAHIYAAAATRFGFFAYGEGGETPSEPDAGLFRSTDGGRTWQEIGAGQVGAVEALAVDPRPAGAVYAGANGDGVFTSRDGGTTWRRSSAKLPVRFGHLPDVRALAIAASRPSTLYAGSTASGAFASDDGAATWRSVGLSDLWISSIAISPSDHRRVIVSASESSGGKLPGGLYRSVDGGRAWRLLAAVGFVVAYDREGSLYTVGLGGTVLRSSDDGASWTELADLAFGPGVG